MWTMITITRNTNGTYNFYTNGTKYNEQFNTTEYTDVVGKLGLCRVQDTQYFNGAIDELGIWKRELSITEITELYNGSVGMTYPFGFNGTTSQNAIAFISQTPSDIDTNNLFSYGHLNISYSFSFNASPLNVSSVRLNYTVINATTWVNGSIYPKYPAVMNQSGNTSNTSYYFEIDADNLYPATYPNYYIENIETVDRALYNLSNSQYLNLSLKNVRNDTFYGIFELMINTSFGTAEIRYCNSSYDGGNPTTDNSCYLFATFSGTGFNHSHGKSKHNIYSFPINISNARIGNVLVTNQSYFLIRGTASSQTYVGYITNSSTYGTSYTSSFSSDNGATYTPLNLTFDYHLHQYTGTETLTYYAYARNTTGTLYNSTLQSDLFQQSIVAPTSPVVLTPNTYNYKQYINISYTPAINITGNIRYYNISILYSNETEAFFLYNNSLNTSYYWNTYSNNLTVGQGYKVKVLASDSNGLSSYALSETFNVSANGLLNLSFYNNQTLVGLDNFTVTFRNLNTSAVETYNTTSYVIYFDAVKNNAYNLSFNSTGYANQNFLYTQNATFVKRNFSVFGYNSIYINIFDEETGARINQSVDISLTSSTTQYNGNTSNGIFYLQDIVADTYAVSFSTIDYAVRDYTITVGNFSSQILNAYLLRSNYTVIFTINNFNTGDVIQGVVMSMYGYVNGTLSLLESRPTDISGKVQFVFKSSTPYSFYCTKSGYEDLSFSLNPILFTSYNIKMTATSTIPSYYSDVNIYYYPKEFIYNDDNTFSINFQSPNGLLTSYGYNVSSNCFNFGFTDTNAMGSRDTNNFVSNCSGNVLVNYYYTISNGNFYNFTDFYKIANAPASNYTFIHNRGKTYGLGDFERILIVTIITLVVVGVASLIGGSLIGTVMGLFIMGYFAWTGFLSFYIIGIFLVIGVIIILSRIREG